MYWKRITCSSSTLINRYSNQEENAEISPEKHSKNHNQKRNWSWMQQVPYEQKTEDSNNNIIINNNINNNKKKKNFSF